jgi:hypothetical protein
MLGMSGRQLADALPDEVHFLPPFFPLAFLVRHVLDTPGPTERA